MLKSVDLLIDFSVVMLVVSMAVTVLTQMVISLRGMRGKNLLRGITSLLAHIDPTLSKKVADTIADSVLRQPLVAEVNGKRGTVIRREELTRILFQLAAGEAERPLDPGVQKELQATLEKTGITDPSQTLQAVRLAVLESEATQPELSASVRESQALLTAASSEFLAKVNSWFDHTMDRVTGAFTYQTRKITTVAALLLVVGLQLDALGLLNRLWMDDELRQALVLNADSAPAHFDSLARRGSPPVRVQNVDHALTDLRELAGRGLVTMPDRWVESWKWDQVPGILLSWALICLGAPFWFNTLKNLLRLRPLIAEKEQGEREARSSESAVGSEGAMLRRVAPAPEPTPIIEPRQLLAPDLDGEQGDLSDMGAVG